MKRLGFTKSRNGCQRCKKRRVKVRITLWRTLCQISRPGTNRSWILQCDEQVPCSACRRHSLTCSLAPEPVAATRKPSSRIAEAASQSWKRGRTSAWDLDGNFLASTLSSGPSSPAFTSSGQPSPADEAISPRLHKLFRNFNPPDGSCHNASNTSASDLELLHHYTSRAYCTFSLSPEINGVLQYDIPREGFSEASLLHQVLAFSALHLAYLHPNHRQRYLIPAYQHQDVALEKVKLALAGELAEEQCHGIYAASIFLVNCAFATLPCSEILNPNFNSIDSLIDIFTLVSGMAAILLVSEQKLRSGPLQGIFPTPNRALPPTAGGLQDVSSFLGKVKTTLADPKGEFYGSDTLVAVSAAVVLLDSISDASRSLLATSPELRIVFVWPLRLSQSYLDLLQRRHPSATVVLAYYTVVLLYGERHCWFLTKWAERLMSSIWEQLSNTPYHKMVEWPLSMVNEMARETARKDDSEP